MCFIVGYANTGIAMRMTIQEVGTLVAVSARNSSRDFQRRRPGRDSASRSATANVPSHDGIGLHRPCLMIASSAVPSRTP